MFAHTATAKGKLLSEVANIMPLWCTRPSSPSYVASKGATATEKEEVVLGDQPGPAKPEAHFKAAKRREGTHNNKNNLKHIFRLFNRISSRIIMAKDNIAACLHFFRSPG